MVADATPGALTLRVGVCGWDHPDWRAGYFPDDLPADWCLGYLGNDLPGILLEPDTWAALDGRALRALVEEVRDGFRFFLRTDLPLPRERVDELQRALGSALGGILAPGSGADGSPLLPAGGGGWGAGGGLRARTEDLPPGDLRARTAWLRKLAEGESAAELWIFLRPPASPGDAVELNQVARLLGLA